MLLLSIKYSSEYYTFKHVYNTFGIPRIDILYAIYSSVLNKFINKRFFNSLLQNHMTTVLMKGNILWSSGKNLYMKKLWTTKHTILVILHGRTKVFLKRQLLSQ